MTVSKINKKTAKLAPLVESIFSVGAMSAEDLEKSLLLENEIWKEENQIIWQYVRMDKVYRRLFDSIRQDLGELSEGDLSSYRTPKSWVRMLADAGHNQKNGFAAAHARLPGWDLSFFVDYNEETPNYLCFDRDYPIRLKATSHVTQLPFAHVTVNILYNDTRLREAFEQIIVACRQKILVSGEFIKADTRDVKNLTAIRARALIYELRQYGKMTLWNTLNRVNEKFPNALSADLTEKAVSKIGIQFGQEIKSQSYKSLGMSYFSAPLPK